MSGVSLRLLALAPLWVGALIALCRSRAVPTLGGDDAQTIQVWARALLGGMNPLPVVVGAYASAAIALALTLVLSLHARPTRIAWNFAGVLALIAVVVSGTLRVAISKWCAVHEVLPAFARLQMPDALSPAAVGLCVGAFALCEAKRRERVLVGAVTAMALLTAGSKSLASLVAVRALGSGLSSFDTFLPGEAVWQERARVIFGTFDCIVFALLAAVASKRGATGATSKAGRTLWRLALPAGEAITCVVALTPLAWMGSEGRMAAVGQALGRLGLQAPLPASGAGLPNWLGPLAAPVFTIRRSAPSRIEPTLDPARPQTTPGSGGRVLLVMAPDLSLGELLDAVDLLRRAGTDTFLACAGQHCGGTAPVWAGHYGPLLQLAGLALGTTPLLHVAVRPSLEVLGEHDSPSTKCIGALADEPNRWNTVGDSLSLFPLLCGTGAVRFADWPGLPARSAIERMGVEGRQIGAEGTLVLALPRASRIGTGYGADDSTTTLGVVERLSRDFRSVVLTDTDALLASIARPLRETLARIARENDTAPQEAAAFETVWKNNPTIPRETLEVVEGALIRAHSEYFGHGFATALSAGLVLSVKNEGDGIRIYASPDARRMVNAAWDLFINMTTGSVSVGGVAEFMEGPMVFGRLLANHPLVPDAYRRALQYAVRRRCREFLPCFVRTGTVTVRFVVGTDGSVSRVEKTGGTLDLRSVECVLKIFRTLQLPAALTQPTTITFELSLNSEQ